MDDWPPRLDPEGCRWRVLAVLFSRDCQPANRWQCVSSASLTPAIQGRWTRPLGYTELMTDGIYGDAPPRLREVLDRVIKSGRHLLSLINDVLDLSKIEAGHLRLSPAEYSMEDVVRTAAAAAEPLAADKGSNSRWR